MVGRPCAGRGNKKKPTRRKAVGFFLCGYPKKRRGVLTERSEGEAARAGRIATR